MRSFTTLFLTSDGTEGYIFVDTEMKVVKIISEFYKVH